jgi:hypothetical protein
METIQEYDIDIKPLKDAKGQGYVSSFQIVILWME